MVKIRSLATKSNYYFSNERKDYAAYAHHKCKVCILIIPKVDLYIYSCYKGVSYSTPLHFLATQGKDPKTHDLVITSFFLPSASYSVFKISNISFFEELFTSMNAFFAFGSHRKSTLLIDKIVSPGTIGALRSKPEELTFVTISLLLHVAKLIPIVLCFPLITVIHIF